MSICIYNPKQRHLTTRSYFNRRAVTLRPISLHHSTLVTYRVAIKGCAREEVIIVVCGVNDNGMYTA